MTVLLEKAFSEATQLSEAEQDALATWILEEIASERRWDAAFGSSTDVLQELAREALAEHHAGRTQVLDPDTLWNPTAMGTLWLHIKGHRRK